MASAEKETKRLQVAHALAMAGRAITQDRMPVLRALTDETLPAAIEGSIRRQQEEQAKRRQLNPIAKTVATLADVGTTAFTGNPLAGKAAGTAVAGIGAEITNTGGGFKGQVKEALRPEQLAMDAVSYGAGKGLGELGAKAGGQLGGKFGSKTPAPVLSKFGVTEGMVKGTQVGQRFGQLMGDRLGQSLGGFMPEEQPPTIQGSTYGLRPGQGAAIQNDMTNNWRYQQEQKYRREKDLEEREYRAKQEDREFKIFDLEQKNADRRLQKQLDSQMERDKVNNEAQFTQQTLQNQGSLERAEVMADAQMDRAAYTQGQINSRQRDPNVPRPPTTAELGSMARFLVENGDAENIHQAMEMANDMYGAGGSRAVPVNPDEFDDETSEVEPGGTAPPALDYNPGADPSLTPQISPMVANEARNYKDAIEKVRDQDVPKKVSRAQPGNVGKLLQEVGKGFKVDPNRVNKSGLSPRTSASLKTSEGMKKTSEFLDPTKVSGETNFNSTQMVDFLDAVDKRESLRSETGKQKVIRQLKNKYLSIPDLRKYLRSKGTKPDRIELYIKDLKRYL